MTWVAVGLAGLAAALFMAWALEVRRHDELKAKALELMGLSLDMMAEVLSLRTQVRMYHDLELGEGPGAMIPDVIGDPDGSVDIRA